MGAAQSLDVDPIENKKNLLRGCQLFVGAEPGVIDFAAAHVEYVSFLKGEPIILENENNDHVYFVFEGAVEIVSYLANEKRVQRLALLKPGSQFAEFSVLTKSTKSGSAYAYENTHLLRLRGAHFMEILRRFPAVSAKLAGDIAHLNEKVQSANDFIPFHRAADLKVPRSIAEVIPLSSWKRFGVIPLSMRGGILSVALIDPNNEEFFQFARAQMAKVEINVYLIDAGEYDDALEFVKSWLKSPASGETRPSSAKDLPAEMKAMLARFLLTSALPASVHDQLIPHLKPVEIKAGQVIAGPDTQHENLFIIQSGSIEVSRAVPQCKGRAHVMTLEAGETMGEVSVLTGKPCSQTYRALENCVLVPVPKTVVKQLVASPMVSIPMAALLANRLTKINALTGLPRFRGSPAPDFTAMAGVLPVSVAGEHKAIPLGVEDGEVRIGIVNTHQQGLSGTLGRYLSGYRVRFLGIGDQQFRQYLDQMRAAQGAAVVEPGPRTGARAGQTAAVDPVKMLEEILLFGVKNRVSDIHFEPKEAAMIVRYRIDGVLQERTEMIATEAAKNIVSRLKILGNMDIANSKITQDGQVKTTIGDIQIVARASVLPVKHGEKVVLRLVRSHESVVPLNMLVPDRRAIAVLQHIAKCKQGLFLVTGPTGSGKTTTLYSLLSEINRVGINIVTLEDPVELEIPGTNQCEVDRKRGVDFSHVLSAVLRQDPDVIMVGEIRDVESAKIVFEAAVTGHLVLSTLHTSYSTDVGPRLAELGVPAATIGTGLLGVVTQRLVRATCKKCLTSRPITNSERDYILGVLGPAEVPKELKSGRGCPSCNNSGYYDRLPVMEVWKNTAPMRQALAENRNADQIIAIARQDGFVTLLEAGVKLALSGITTLDEVRRCLGGI